MCTPNQLFILFSRPDLNNGQFKSNHAGRVMYAPEGFRELPLAPLGLLHLFPGSCVVPSRPESIRFCAAAVLLIGNGGQGLHALSASCATVVARGESDKCACVWGGGVRERQTYSRSGGDKTRHGMAQGSREIRCTPLVSRRDRYFAPKEEERRER